MLRMPRNHYKAKILEGSESILNGAKNQAILIQGSIIGEGGGIIAGQGVMAGGLEVMNEDDHHTIDEEEEKVTAVQARVQGEAEAIIDVDTRLPEVFLFFLFLLILKANQKGKERKVMMNQNTRGSHLNSRVKGRKANRMMMGRKKVRRKGKRNRNPNRNLKAQKLKNDRGKKQILRVHFQIKIKLFFLN